MKASKSAEECGTSQADILEKGTVITTNEHRIAERRRMLILHILNVLEPTLAKNCWRE
jgi:hypothetical protein